MRDGHWPARIQRWITWYLPALLLVPTKTSSAWIACDFMFVVHAVWFDHRFLLTFPAAPLLVLIDPSLLDRVVELGGSTEVGDFSQLGSEVGLNSFEWRQVLWQPGITWIIDRSLFGHGLESFRPSTALFFAVYMAGGQIDAHNYYLQIAFEMAWSVSSRWYGNGRPCPGASPRACDTTRPVSSSPHA